MKGQITSTPEAATRFTRVEALAATDEYRRLQQIRMLQRLLRRTADVDIQQAVPVRTYGSDEDSGPVPELVALVRSEVTR